MREIYEDLIYQYDNLSLAEKKAILIYKSNLSKVINQIASIVGFEKLSSNEIIDKLDNIDKLKEYINKFNTILNLNKNMLVKYSIFGDINLNDFNLLIDDLKNVYLTLIQAKNKITLKEDLVVYRAVSLNDGQELNDISRSTLISTSIKLEDTEPFLKTDKKNILYIIKLKKGTPVLVSPTSLICSYKNKDEYLESKLNGKIPDALKIVDRGINGQEEVILFKNQLEITYDRVEETKFDNQPISIYYVDTFPIITNKKRKK